MKYDNFAQAIDDLLYCAYKFDDKPHLLFSCVRKFAEQYEPSTEQRTEIVRLMDEAYETLTVKIDSATRE